MKIHPQILPAKLKELLTRFQKNKPDFLKNFYLAGETAVALQLGHRESVDLDFFSGKNFRPEILRAQLSQFGPVEEVASETNTLNCFLSGVKLQFLVYPYRLLQPPINWQGIKISSLIDLACTKLDTISSRGTKRDFIDFYFLLKRFSWQEIWHNFCRKYQGIDFNRIHIFKSLIYFEKAEKQPMPRMHLSVEWQEVKNTFIDLVRSQGEKLIASSTNR